MHRESVEPQSGAQHERQRNGVVSSTSEHYNSLHVILLEGREVLLMVFAASDDTLCSSSSGLFFTKTSSVFWNLIMATVPSNSTRSCSSFSLLTDGPKALFDSVFSSTLCSSYRLFSEDFPRPDSGSWTVSCRPRWCGNDQYATCATHAWFSSSPPFPGCTWGRGSSRHNAFVSLPVGNNCIRIQCSIELRRG